MMGSPNMGGGWGVWSDGSVMASITVLVLVSLTFLVVGLVLIKGPNSMRIAKKKSQDVGLKNVIALARDKGGILTVSTILLAFDITLERAEELLDELVGRGIASIDVELSVDQGVETLTFPEFRN